MQTHANMHKRSENIEEPCLGAKGSQTEAFLKWVKGSDYMPFIISGEHHDDIFIRIPKDEKFVFIYYDRAYKSSMSEMPKELEYEAIFYRETEKLYHTGLAVKDWFPELISDGANKMAENVQEAVRRRVEDVMNYSSVAASGYMVLPTEQQEQLERFCEQRMNSYARSLFLNGETSETYAFTSTYCFAGWRENDMLTYIASPEYFAELQFKEYYAKKKDDLRLEYAQYEAVKEELGKIEGMMDSQLHRLKDIMKAANNSEAKKLVVTICKEGTNLSFKIEANELRRDPSSFYGTWNIEAKDRRFFEETYGKHAHFRPEDIIDISYCGKSIYSAEPYIPAPVEEQGITMKQ